MRFKLIAALLLCGILATPLFARNRPPDIPLAWFISSFNLAQKEALGSVNSEGLRRVIEIYQNRHDYKGLITSDLLEVLIVFDSSLLKKISELQDSDIEIIGRLTERELITVGRYDYVYRVIKDRWQTWHISLDEAKSDMARIVELLDD